VKSSRADPGAGSEGAAAAVKLTNVEERICTIVKARAGAMVSDLRMHVGLATGHNNKGPLDQGRYHLTQRLARLGANVELVPGDPKPPWLHGVEPGGYIPPTAVCRRKPRRSNVHPVPLLISGHLDTVHDPAGPFRQLTISPDGKTATGPGCVDMKGGLVIAVAALEILEEAGIETAWTFALNSDEETGSYHSEAALRAQARRIHAEGGVGLVLEPALPDGSLVVERLGSGQFMIEAHGRAAHVGRDFDKGISAITSLAERLIDVSRLSQPYRGRIVNVGIVEGGVGTNVVPDQARAWGNVRFPNRGIADEIEAGLLNLRTADAETIPSVEVHTSFNRPAKPLTPETRRLAEFARAAAEDLGQQLPFGKTGGVCDGNILQDEGLPTIDTLGVRGGGLHTPQEWIDLSSLVERCQLFAILVARLSAGALK
jgi:glutamate carboxypeptidase